MVISTQARLLILSTDEILEQRSPSKILDQASSAHNTGYAVSLSQTMAVSYSGLRRLTFGLTMEPLVYLQIAYKCSHLFKLPSAFGNGVITVSLLIMLSHPTLGAVLTQLPTATKTEKLDPSH
ncbi:hypothetical protein ABKN59_002120 [Abortiporus biennis]